MEQTSPLTQKLDRALYISLLLLVLAAPVSIAATQTAWALSMLIWIVRAFVVRPKIKFDLFGIVVLIFIGLTLLSSVFSYEPEVSLRKMVAVSLVSIVFLFAENVKDKQTARLFVVALLVSCAFSVAFTVAARIIGKNLKVYQMTADSPLRAAGVQETDTILTANGKNINNPDELLSVFSTTQNNEPVKLLVYRHELLVDCAVHSSLLLTGEKSAERLGIVSWSRGRDTRAAGFYGHYTTYAEVLQLIASIALGLLIIFPGGYFAKNRVLLAVAVGAYCFALLLTLTRASWASFFVSASIMILIGASRRTVLICLACAVPLILGGLFFLQQKRKVGFVDSKDGSTQWRLIVWREGFDLLKSNSRHLFVGIGMDSIKTHWREWKMFDNGKQPIGHMHSTPLQLALERGVPTLLAWLFWIGLYCRKLWQSLKHKDWDWQERGFLLGAFGGTIGFITSSLVHYNWGDSEVVMIFYLLMGLSLATMRGLKSNTELKEERA